MHILRYLFFAALCCLVVAAAGFGQNCPNPPHPTIVSSFIADTSCQDPHSNPGAGNDHKACLVACENSYTTYCVLSIPTNTYSWTVSGGTIIGSATNNCVTILWGPAGAGQLNVTETDTSGCVGTDEACIKIINSPIAAFTAATNVCKGTPVSFINQSLNATSYFWNFGDGNVSTLVNPTHSYSTAGTYTITLVAFNKCGCSDSVTHTINVSNLQGPDIECPATVCAFAKECYFTTPACSTAVYHWSATGGTILGPSVGSGLTSVCVQWGAGPQGTISLYITGCGSVCPDTTTALVPIITNNGPITGPLTVCSGSTTVYTLPLWPGTYYSWSTTCGTIIGGQNSNAIQVSWPPFFTGTCTIIATWNNILLGCGGQDTITVNVLPEFLVVGPPGPFCIGDNISFSASAPANWSVTGGTVVSGNGTANAIISFTTGGLQTVTATPVNPAPWCNPSASQIVSVVSVPAPLAITGPGTICTGSTYTYNVTPSGAGFTYFWTAVGGSIVGSNTGASVQVTWSGAGTLSVQQVMTSAPFCKSAPISIPVSVLSIANITGPGTVCMDQTATYSAGSPNPSIVYTWTIPGAAGTITGGQGTNSITVLWHGPGGPSTVSLSVCNLNLNLPIVVKPKPTPTISMTGYVCDPGGGVTLTVNPAFASYSWSNGGTNQSTNVSASGQYCVTVTDAFGCTAQVCIDVPHTPGPTASISTPDPINYCSSPPPTISTTMYALQGPNYQYFWVPGGAITPTFTATSAGSYYCIVTDAVTGCQATSNTITITVAPCGGGGGGCTPQAYTLDFTTSNVAGACNNIQFTQVSTNVSNFTWQFGDGGNGTGPSPTHLYAQAGYYQVTICGDVPSTTTGTCHVCTTKAISVPVAAQFGFVNNCGSVTFNDVSTFLPGFTITGWNWTFTGGTPGSDLTQTPPPVTFASGPHLVTLVVTSSSGCTSTFSQVINVTGPPSAAFTLPSTACVGLNVPMSAGPAFTWSWDFGDGATSATATTSHAWAAPGTYVVTLIVSNASGCKDTVSHSITIVSPGGGCTITPPNPGPICAGDSVVMTASPGATYQWQLNGVNIPATGQTYAALVGGSYKCIITDVNGCVCTTAVVVVTVNPLPPAIITSTGSLICGAGCVTLSAPTGPYTYLWSDGSTQPTLVFCSGTPGNYPFTVTLTDSAAPFCTATSVPFIVHVRPIPPPPTITPSGPTTFCKGGSVTLTASPGTNILWSTGAITPSITVYTSGVYSVTYTAPTGCTSSASITVTLSTDPDFSLFPIGCDTLCDTVKIPGPIGPYPGYYTYQWLYNGSPIAPPNGTNDTLTPVGSGNYQLILTGPGPAFCVDTSNIYKLQLHKCDSCFGKICGRKWQDQNGNGKFNYGTEHGIKGWRICLVKCNIDGYPGKDTVACTLTDSLGFYCFEHVPCGCYCVVEQKKTGWAQTWPVHPNYYCLTLHDGQSIMGLDFGNKFKCIDIWTTADTIGIPPNIDVISNVTLPASVPWPYKISYQSEQSAPFIPIFEGIVTNVINPFNPCNPGKYRIVRKHLGNYHFDRIYVNDVLVSDNGDSVDVVLEDSTGGGSIVFLNVYQPDTTVRFRTFTAAQLAQADQAKPVKRAKPNKPIIMPNTANVIDEALRQGGIAIVGLPNRTLGGHIRGYLQPAKQSDVFKTFNTKGFTHSGTPRGLDFTVKQKPIMKRQKTLPATKQDNKFLANLLALKINILASEYGKTPPGFGDLVYLNPQGTSPWFVDGPECTINMIAERADSLLTVWDGITYQEYADLNAIIESLNEAFSGSLLFGERDTLSWITGGKLHLAGTKALSEVPFLLQLNIAAPRSKADRPFLEQIPDEFILEQNYPNPFNPTTQIQFTLPEQGVVTLKIYDVLGQEISTLIDHQNMDDGTSEIEFDARSLSSGVYFYHLTLETTGDFEEGTTGRTYHAVKKMLLMK